MLDKASSLILFMLFLSNFLSSLASPLLPPFIKDERGIAEIWTGIFFTIYAIAFTIIAFITGKLVDRIKHKKVIFCGALMMSASTFCYGLISRI
jgi:MFS family permease